MRSGQFVCRSVSVQLHTKSYVRIYEIFLPAVDLGTLSQAGFILDWPSLIDLHCHLEVTDAQQGRFDCNAETVRDTAKVTIEHW